MEDLEAAEAALEFDESPEQTSQPEAASEPRVEKRRGRRHRGRRNRRERPDERERPVADESSVESVAHESEQGDLPRPDAELRTPAAEGPVPNEPDDLHPDEGGDEAGDEGGEGLAKAHRAIPSWEETVGLIISANMESRARNPQGRGFRGRRN